MKIVITYNNELNPGLKGGWGFSCLIEENNKKILFDTGCSGPDLIYNMKKLGYNAQEIDILILSHQHWDHIGGLFEILESNKKVEVFVLKSFSENLKNEIRKRAKLREVEHEQEITTNIYTTGLIKNDPDEQSLILKTPKGIIVIVGCSHPGVDKILDIAKKYGKIYAIIGGFHDFSDFEILKDIKLIGACHCTKYKEKIKEKYPEQFREIKSGDVIE
jgi:7,8-dihydropterin-6-yl-methyl-4-(beta-D-ribofuranosyl)aminobenzene 5'-phosphate synthase